MCIGGSAGQFRFKGMHFQFLIYPKLKMTDDVFNFFAHELCGANNSRFVLMPSYLFGQLTKNLHHDRWSEYEFALHVRSWNTDLTLSKTWILPICYVNHWRVFVLS